MSYLITLDGEDKRFSCEDDQIILDAALQQGITLAYGCKNGLCGSCKAKVISGSIDYPEGKPKGLSEEDEKNHQALLCKATACSDLTLKAQLPKVTGEVEVKTLPAKVKSITHLSDDVIQMILQLPAVEPFHFNAGQWIYFLLNNGKKRAFSIANRPNDNNELELQIRHAIGGVFTDFVFNELKPGALLQIEGPHGTFYFQQDDRPILLVAGGTGFAPIKGILEEILHQGVEQKIHLYWGSKSSKDLYLQDLAQSWAEQKGIQYTPVLSEPLESDNWHGKTGYVHEAVLQDYDDLSDYAVYMAGPPQMIESCKQSFSAAGLDESRLYYDSFDYSIDALDAMKGKED
jgi:CDP-4-dehydro-6-deoxyglucose reductase